jgi:CubicO group peptidase (beta-lactamase class C family)
MAEQTIPGLAVALVDADHELWVEGFGDLDGPDSAPVTPDTIFSIQSMSKLFTATAVMQAVAAGRLDLDVPITAYLPSFTVHSAFEERPERSITLRMLLSHTACFTMEAPIGNNNELDPGDFDAHVESISDTWLRFPVGTGYAYSNLGIDLAGSILERVEGKPFPDVMRDSLLGPLGMDRSTFDRTVIRSADGRAIGHVDPFPAGYVPIYEPMMAAGGMYSSAADLARFLRFQLNDGSLDGGVVLAPKAMEEMRTVPAPHAGAPAGYALGVVRHRWNRWPQAPDLFDHGGGGFGFLSELWWSPQLGIGIAILINADDQQPISDLALSILTDLVADPGPYRDRLLALPARPGVRDPSTSYVPPAGMDRLVAGTARPSTGDEAARWAAYVGSFGAPKWGAIDPAGPAGRFLVDGGVPYFEVREEGTLERFPLVEIAPHVFLAKDGETLDMAGPVPMWRGVRLVRLTGGPAPWQWAILTAVVLLTATWLAAAVARGIRRIRSRSASTLQSAATARWRGIGAAAMALTALLALANAGLVAATPGLVDAGFLGWLELPLIERLGLHLPLAMAVAAAGSAVLVAAGVLRRWWSKAVSAQHVALAVGTVALVGQLAAWRLIGWGWG